MAVQQRIRQCYVAISSLPRTASPAKTCIRTGTVRGRWQSTITQRPRPPPFPSSAPNPPSPYAKPPSIHSTDTDSAPQGPLAPFQNGQIYMTPHINGFPFLVTLGDAIHLPFHLKDAPLGSVLRMTHVSSIGSRSHILQGHPFINPDCFTLKMRVVEITKAPMVVTVKTKQRTRRARHMKNKQNYTVVRVCEMKVHDVDPFGAGGVIEEPH